MYKRILDSVLVIGIVVTVGIWCWYGIGQPAMAPLRTVPSNVYGELKETVPENVYGSTDSIEQERDVVELLKQEKEPFPTHW